MKTIMKVDETCNAVHNNCAKGSLSDIGDNKVGKKYYAYGMHKNIKL